MRTSSKVVILNIYYMRPQEKVYNYSKEAKHLRQCSHL